MWCRHGVLCLLVTSLLPSSPLSQRINNSSSWHVPMGKSIHYLFPCMACIGMEKEKERRMVRQEEEAEEGGLGSVLVHGVALLDM